ncbi:hypothetical protein BKA70DRAFT_1555881 [Coprinopsis sp. MPI-PUGE-AT-0042]|nr:hypothetical protein BKA70DRAFT_1555881 [Coprinopsis sp. MPI-PUGE-AT-0042]
MRLFSTSILFGLAALALAQSDEDASSSQQSQSNRPTASAPRTTVFTSTFRSAFETTLSNGDVSTGSTSGVTTITSVIGGDQTTARSSSRSTSSTPKPTAPTEGVSGGGGVKGAPAPGQAGVGGAYGPDDNYIAAATKMTLGVSLLSGVVAGAALVLI